jgi:hypothetical protein
MEDDGLVVDVIPVLQSILVDYPGGQLLEEALQNAEDSGAETFSLLLDLRHHEGVDPRLSGPAFVLLDSGKGLQDREWDSLRNLYNSKKRDNPSEIGQYGMGSRSYFHYSDVIQICSNDIYQGLDPLKCVKSHGRTRAGWRVRMSATDLEPNAQARQREARQLFFSLPPALRPDRGAAFRLPLRREEDVNTEDGLGPAMTPVRANALLDKWANTLRDGSLIMFLARIKTVSIWRWAQDNDAPTLVSQLNKRFLEGGPCERLPLSLPPSARETYGALSQHLAAQSEAQLKSLSEPNIAVVNMELSGACKNSSTTATKWLIVQRFDVANREIREAMVAGCRFVPVVGVGMWLGKTPLAGAPFCFLPIGSMQTGLPVHLHASFAVHKNRRSLWYEVERKDQDASSGSDQHAMWSRWNELVLTSSLPALWLEVLLLLRERAERADASTDTSREEWIKMMASALPDLQTLDTPWKECAVELYSRARDSPILQHARVGKAAWVCPANATLFEAPPAFQHQAQELLRVYSACRTFGSLVVQLPAHVASACALHAGMGSVNIETFLERLVRCIEGEADIEVKIDSLSPSFLALAEHLDGVMDKCNQKRWAQILAKHAWMPLLGGGRAKVSQAFDSEQLHLRGVKLGVVESNRADLHSEGVINLEAVLRVLRVFGLKTELCWSDVVQEARDVAAQGDTNRARRLLHYLGERFKHMLPPPAEDLQALQDLAFIPGVRPALCAPHDDEPPESKEEYCFKPLELLPRQNCCIVWAVRATATVQTGWGLRFGVLSINDIIQQITLLASHKPSVHVARHLLKCCQALQGMPSILGAEEYALQSQALSELEVAWVPSLVGGSLTLALPSHVARSSNLALSPSFGTLLDDWRAGLTTGFLDLMGVKERLGSQVLIEELNALAQSPMDAAALKLATNLAMELGDHCAGDEELRQTVVQTCHVPTQSGKLVIASCVFINDASMAEACELLHDGISPNTGRQLGCTSVRDELARRCEEEGGGFEVDRDKEDFGQSEKLADRIEGLLRDYNGQHDVFVEHWQNTDDHGANSILFCLDESQYSTDNMVDERACELQGPALLLASSNPLSSGDIAAMQRLGASAKRSSFGAVGRFGVGINCMYSKSDAFTLLANGARVRPDAAHGDTRQRDWQKVCQHEACHRFPKYAGAFQAAECEVAHDLPTASAKKVLRLWQGGVPCGSARAAQELCR